jgi:hypothetical protein
MGAYDKAVADFTKAIDGSTSDTEYYLLNRCESYDRLNENEKALKDLLELKKMGVVVEPDLERSVMSKSKKSLE